MPLVDTVLYGLLAGASAVAAAAVLVVLRTQRTRINGIAFAIGFLVTQLLLCLLALALGTGSIPTSGTSHRIAEAVIEIVLGVALLTAAQRVRHPEARAPRTRGPAVARLRARQAEVLDKLGGLRPGAVLGTGALLGIGPKRILVTMLAAAAIATANGSRTVEGSLLIVYVLLATAWVWVPVVLAVFWGARAAEWTEVVQQWWAEHRATATFVPLVALGAYLVVAGVIALFNA
jgi:hypothetical protein